MNGNRIYVKVYAGDLIYDRLAISITSVDHFVGKQMLKTPSRLVHLIRIRLTGVTLHCLIKALTQCQQCRDVIVNYIWKLCGINRVRIHLKSQETCVDTIDYKWNEKCYHLARERAELDHTLSWLSTLGGAFSALGDYFVDCAETAAKISAHQFQLALRMGDPNIASRCRLYYALSLIQRKEFRLAKRLVLNEYSLALSDASADPRLVKMCKGIWSKLKYEWALHRKHDSREKKIYMIKTGP